MESLGEPARAWSRNSRSQSLVRVWLDGVEPRPEKKPSVHQHATRLLLWLQDNPNIAGHFVLAADLKRIYPQLCCSMGWQPYHWNTLARELRELTERRKRYCWHNHKRLRVYPGPVAAKPQELRA